MKRVWIIGGTTEGRRFTQALRGIAWVCVSVATPYGASLIQPSEHVKVLSRRLNEPEMEETIRCLQPDCIVDATHPYATAVTSAVRAAAQSMDCPYFRILRPGCQDKTQLIVQDFSEAVELLESLEGNIFLTTGSKNLNEFIHISHYKERIALRILPMAESLQRALALGYAPSRIVCMQGPFSAELNAETWRHFHSRYIVTKDSGTVGGFEEKRRAAGQIGARLVIIGRSGSEPGDTYDEVLQQVIQLCYRT